MIETLWRMSIYGSVLIVPILAARLLLRKYPTEYSYVLWMPVLVRLLVPVFIVGSMSLQPDLPVLTFEGQMDGYTQDMQIENNEKEYDLVKEAEKGKADNRRENEQNRFLTEVDLEATDRIFVGHEISRAHAVWILKLLYLAGLFITSAVFVIQYAKLKRRIAAAVPDGKNIWLCEKIPSAFVMGVIRPSIYLPDFLEPAERWYVVKHEEMHIRHGDPWIRAAGTVVLCLHWWNPAVWYGIYKLYQDMEMRCDEFVMEEASSAERKTYAGILLRLSAKQSGFAALCFGESHTEKRIKNVLKEKKKRTVFLVIAFSMFIVFCGGAFLTIPRKMEKTAVSEQGKNMVTEEYSIEEMPVYLEGVILSDTPVKNEGRIRYIQLVMTEGEYFTEEYAGTGGGTYAENYRGTYEFWVLDENRNRISLCPVKDEFGETTFNFGRDFRLEFADYNADGCVDFTLGTWGSSSMGLYYLYTLLDSGEITSACPEAIADMGLEFSRRFELAETGFVVYTYNNATGTYSRIRYQWEEEQGMYVKGEEEEVMEDEETS